MNILRYEPIIHWDDAYANASHIENGETYPARWKKLAAQFRQKMINDGRAQCDISYGTDHRQRLDLFYPTSGTRGVLVFVHGGYWRAFDKSFWSHCAAGALGRGWAVVLPTYRLAPQARIGEIAHDVQRAIKWAGHHISGPIRLAGHSAGGHLVTRAICEGSHLQPDIFDRIEHVISVSGVHDLRPLMRTALNEDLRLDAAQCATESPALLNLMRPIATTCWVGAQERPEFLRQSALLANIWSGLGAQTKYVIEAQRHHFDICDSLCRSEAPLTKICAPS